MSAPLTPLILAEVTTDVLADSAYVLPAASVLPEAWACEVEVASLPLLKPRRGTLALVATRLCCRELAANMLGVELAEVRSEMERQDALGELVNVAGGMLLARINGVGTSSLMGTPYRERLTAADANTRIARADCAASLRLDSGERIDVLVLWDEKGQLR